MERDGDVIAHLKTARSPVIVLINKCDAASAEQMESVRKSITETGFDKVLAISAKTGKNLDQLEQLLCSYLTEGPQYYPEDMVTDQPERLICAEMIREKTLELLREEIPHGIGVAIDKMELRKDGALMDVWATIFCERESHKGIIIGRGGKMLKRIGMEARKDIEWLLNVQVNLQLWIKVKEDWRNRQQMLNELGYRDE